MTIEDALKQIRADIAQYSSNRAVTLVAITKRQPIESMQVYQEIAASLGMPVIFGENYVQELAFKREQLAGDIEWHLTGPLQSNKISEAVRLSDVIQSVHSTKVIDGIAKAAREQGIQQRIFLQVNIGQDSNKRGFSVEELEDAIVRCESHSQGLCLCGLMTITPHYEDPHLTKKDFEKLARVRNRLEESSLRRCFHQNTITLSMGMSGDYQVALEAGADIIRIGSLLFGARL